MANIFNNYFVSLTHTLRSNIPTVNIDPLSYVSNNSHSFAYFDCTSSEIAAIINNLKSNKCSIFEVPVNIYKKTADILSPIICTLVNHSINQGVFPNVLKLARVIPLHKGGTKKDMKNFRPISILPILSKIFEKIMHKRLYNFFIKFGLLYSNQFGFLKNKSTVDAIIRFTDECYDVMNDNKSLISIYLDFSKAFDTIDHDLLCKKLHAYGIRGFANNWFISYLSCRKQFVQIDSNKSTCLELISGVPQGSVLGPLLFIIYINDMHKCTDLKLIHFADDSTAYIAGRDILTLTNSINSELVKIDKWVSANKLSLNAEKTNFSLFSNQKTFVIPDIHIRNSKIQRTSCHKFLGIMLDEKLNFQNHINSICLKISRSIGILWKISEFIPPSALNTIYYSFIYPHLIYAIEVWGNSSKVALDRLNSKVNRAQRIIKGDCYELNFKYLSLKEIHRLFCLTRFFGYYKLQSNVYFFNKISCQKTNHNFNTRFSTNNSLLLPKLNISKLNNSFFYSSIKYWNALPQAIKTCNSLIAFEKKCKTSYNNKLNLTYAFLMNFNFNFIAQYIFLFFFILFFFLLSSYLYWMSNGLTQFMYTYL